MGALLCTLTLLPNKTCVYPQPHEDLKIRTCWRGDAIFNFAKEAPFLENNLCISYQGKQCAGTFVEVFCDAKFKGERWEAILEHNAGTICMPDKVSNSASSIFAILPKSGVLKGTDLNLQMFFENGLIQEPALKKLQKEDPAVIIAALRKLEEAKPETLEKLANQMPLSLDKVSALLKA